MRLILLNDDTRAIAYTPEEIKAVEETVCKNRDRPGYDQQTPTHQIPVLDIRGVEGVRPEAVAELVRSAIARSQGLE